MLVLVGRHEDVRVVRLVPRADETPSRGPACATRRRPLTARTYTRPVAVKDPYRAHGRPRSAARAAFRARSEALERGARGPRRPLPGTRSSRRRARQSSSTPQRFARQLSEPLPERGDAARRTSCPSSSSASTPGLGATTGGRYLGYVTGGLLPAGAIAQAWAVAVDQNTGLWALAPAASELELVVLSLARRPARPPAPRRRRSRAAPPGRTSSASPSRATGPGRQQGVDVNAAASAALDPIAVYGSTELHFTNVKALRTLGLGADCVRHVPVDDALPPERPRRSSRRSSATARTAFVPRS